MKITGKEFKAFLESEEDTWGGGFKFGECWMNIEVHKNGIPVAGDEWVILDTDNLVVTGKVVSHKWENGEYPSLPIAKAIKNWRKTLTHTTVVVEIPHNVKEDVLQYLKNTSVYVPIKDILSLPSSFLGEDKAEDIIEKAFKEGKIGKIQHNLETDTLKGTEIIFVYKQKQYKISI